MAPGAFVLPIAGITVLAHASVAWACSCLQPAGPPCALGANDVAFVGSVTWQSEDREANGGEGVSRSLFSVSEAFAGVGGGQIEVQSDLTSCGVQFAKGRSYLVMGGRREDGSVGVHACSNTGPAEAMKDEIAMLRALRDGQSAKRVYGRVIEFREPQPHNRSGDPELYQPLAHIRVTAAGAQEFRETTNPEGRFEFEGLPKGQYRVAIYVEPPKRVLPHGTGFHQADSDPAAVIVEDCPARVSFTVSEWTELISNLAPLLEARACEGAAAWPSLPSQTAATIRFDNGRVSPVRVYWIDFAGNRVLYQTIPPGQAVYQPTFESHRWMVTTEADECLELYEPSGSRSIAEIRKSEIPSVHLPAAASDRQGMRREDAPVAHFIGELRHVALDLPTQAADQGVEAPGLGHVNGHVRADAAAPHLQVAQFDDARTWTDIWDCFVGLPNDSSAAVAPFALYGCVHKTSVARRTDAGWGDSQDTAELVSVEVDG